MGHDSITINIDEARVRPWEIWHLQSDNTKLYSVIEKKSLTSLEDSLEKTIQYFKDNGNEWNWV
jgi:GDP-D-mannose dehydratase